jgi:pimeloyl-ACP methyl ester carboxylesterase
MTATRAHWAAAVGYNALARYEEAASAARQAASDALNHWIIMWGLPELVEAAARGGDAESARDSLERLADTTQPCGTDFARSSSWSSSIRRSATPMCWGRARPQTLTGLADSPVGLAAFLLDHDARSYELISRAFVEGDEGGLSRDDVLDNLTLFWSTDTAISSGRLYWENKFSFFAAKNVSIPVAVSVFPDEPYRAPRRWAEKAYPNLIYFNEVDRGGHFAAREQPELLASELRAGFRSLR